MVIHVAIVSHGHENLLISSKLGGLLGAVSEHTAATQELKVWIKDNKPSAQLNTYCQQHGIAYTDAKPGLGFGDNNNFLYDLIQKTSGFGAGDTFIVMNPDITIAAETIFQLVAQMHADRCPIATLNLYRDPAFNAPDANIRPFPDVFSAFRMAVGRAVAQPYDKNKIHAAGYVDWASGAFLAFDPIHYAALKGFNPDYFMYFEDVDICYRSEQLLGNSVRYYPHLKAIHSAAHKNRSLASKHALWFFQSFFKFLFRRYFIYGKRNSIASSK